MWDPKIYTKTEMIDIARGQSEGGKRSPGRDSNANVGGGSVIQRKDVCYSLNNLTCTINTVLGPLSRHLGETSGSLLDSFTLK